MTHEAPWICRYVDMWINIWSEPKYDFSSIYSNVINQECGLCIKIAAYIKAR